ncbi:uncharacterized protein LOC135206972 [Macrobrachium nipponense]|uniref:uncharacterized protein LOC135206972 n=1 Tax=Macrobrachium nipponense TaxID=159736 RepID=UPI0030C7D823
MFGFASFVLLLGILNQASAQIQVSSSLASSGIKLATGVKLPNQVTTGTFQGAGTGGFAGNYLELLADLIPGGGVPGQDFPLLPFVPRTGFTCNGLLPGYYADASPDAQCQAFHVCHLKGNFDSFLCPNGTLFNQQYFVCDWWFNVDCSLAQEFYFLNADIGKVDSQSVVSKAGAAQSSAGVGLDQQIIDESGSFGLGQQVITENAGFGLDQQIVTDAGFGLGQEQIVTESSGFGAGSSTASRGPASSIIVSTEQTGESDSFSHSSSGSGFTSNQGLGTVTGQEWSSSTKVSGSKKHSQSGYVYGSNVMTPAGLYQTPVAYS